MAGTDDSAKQPDRDSAASESVVADPGSGTEDSAPGESAASNARAVAPRPQVRGEDAVARWRRARREVYAAQSILVSAGCHPRSSIVHLVAAWELLFGLYPEGQSQRDIPKWIREGGASVSVAERDAVATTVARLLETGQMALWEVDGSLPDTSELLAHTRLLHRILGRVDAELFEGADRRRQRRRWLVRGGVAVAALVGLLIYLQLSQTPGTGRWRAEYYRTPDLSGPAIIRRDKDIAFDWGEGRPLDQIRPQEFSVRWDTCLGMGQTTSANFELAADAGGRLYVDGEVVIDTWASQAPSQRGALVLEQGVHHVRVEYYKRGGAAAVRLTVSFDNRRRQSIPPGILRYPDDEVDHDDPCETEER